MSKPVFKDYAGNKALASGRMVTFRTEMKPYEDHRMRTIRVLLPKDYDGTKRFPVLYLHDGQNLFAGHDRMQKWYVDRAMKTLSKEGLSIIIVGIDTAATRFSELCPNYPINKRFLNHKMTGGAAPTGDQYAAFVVNSLKPIIDRNFKTLKKPEYTGIGGSSMGGLMSFDMILRYPETFGRALVFSPAFISFPMKDLLNRINQYDIKKLKDHRLFFYNGGQTLMRLTTPMIKVYDKLVSKGLTSNDIAMMTDSREPHFEDAWCKYFPEAVRYLFVKDLPKHETTFDPEALKEYFDKADKGE